MIPVWLNIGVSWKIKIPYVPPPFWFRTQNRYSIPQNGVLFLLCNWSLRSCTMWVASPWGFSGMTIQPARHEWHACCLLRAGFVAFQPVADNTCGTRVEQVVSSFQKILRGSQLTCTSLIVMMTTLEFDSNYDIDFSGTWMNRKITKCWWVAIIRVPKSKFRTKWGATAIGGARIQTTMTTNQMK